MHVFLISMPQPGPRRTNGLSKVRMTGLPFDIVDGVEAANWRPETLPMDGAWGRPLLPGEVGCYMAHLRALQRIVDRDLPWGCILEDDFCYEADADVGLAELEPTLPPMFEYVHLQRDIGLNPGHQVLATEGLYHRIIGTPLCALGYVASRRLAERVLAGHATCRMPIDHLYNQLSYDGRFYKLVKPVVGIQVGLDSVIHAARIGIDSGAHQG
jgi:GR25 family glycosyltransferase involved in LPS biosynthesis